MTEKDKLKSIIKKLLPVVEAAYWDHSSAGHIPGSGYSHKCYSKLPFNWRQTKEFEAWVKEIKDLIEPTPALSGDEEMG